MNDDPTTSQANIPTAAQPTDPQPQINQPPTAAPIMLIQPKSSKKLILLVLTGFLTLAVGAGAAYYFIKNDNPVAETTKKSAQLTLPNQPKQLNNQFGTPHFTSGYVTYDASKFEVVDTALPKIKSVVSATTDTTDKQVIFMSDLSYKPADNSRRLLMYDVVSQKTYIVAKDSSVGSYNNAKIMSDHYVVYASESQTDPLTSNVAIKSVDLNTGKLRP